MSYVFTEESRLRGSITEDESEAFDCVSGVRECSPGCSAFGILSDAQADEAATFWQRPTFTERDISEARTDSWDRGYVAGVLDGQAALAADYGGTPEDVYAAAQEAVDRADALALAEGRREGVGWGVLLGTLAVLLGYVIASHIF